MAPTSPPTLYRLSATKGKYLVFRSFIVDHAANKETAHFGITMSNFSCCSQKLLRSPRKPTRKISKIPFKVLDAPELQDDFYLNLVDWSSLNVLSVGLGTCVYLWSACTSQVKKYICVSWQHFITMRRPSESQAELSFPQVTRLCDLSVEGDSVTSVGWSERVSTQSLLPSGKLSRWTHDTVSFC